MRIGGIRADLRCAHIPIGNVTAKWTAADLPDMAGRTVVITGATSGIGLVTARELARACARVTLAVRDPGKGRLSASDSPVRSLSAHPGIATTSLAAYVGGMQGLVNRATRFMVNDAEHGALPTLYAATQDIPGGSYVGPEDTDEDH